MTEIKTEAERVERADETTWFCERGDFWGTGKQILLCAKCGKSEMKRHDEPRHYSGLFTPRLHMVCDECFDSLPAPSSPVLNQKGIEHE